MLGDGKHLLPMLVNQILPTPCVVVECWETVEELTATLHVPTVQGVEGVTLHVREKLTNSELEDITHLQFIYVRITIYTYIH